MTLDPLPTEIVVLGSGAGGITAAFHAADQGKKVTLIDSDSRFGGVCLHTGCIPSKALLHATKLIRDAKRSQARGIDFGAPRVNLEKLRAWKDSIVEKLSNGLAELVRRRSVTLLRGKARFKDSQTIEVQAQEGNQTLSFEKAVIAAGSRPNLPPPFDSFQGKIWTSEEALKLESIPKRLLIVGGGYIGLELGTVYQTLGSEVTLVEMTGSLLPGVDADLILPVSKYAGEHFKSVRLKTTVSGIQARGDSFRVTFEGERGGEETFDQVLVAAGRIPNSGALGLEKTKVQTDKKGFIRVNANGETEDPSIYALGDVAGGMLLAHKASHEARVVIDYLLGKSRGEGEAVIPAVIFTDPEIAWCGLTENEAKQRGVNIKTVRFPWAASGRAVTLDRTDGMTKLVIDPETERILGAGIVGEGAGELISEGVLAVEKRLTARELARIIHPHPTLSETFQEAAARFYTVPLSLKS